MKYCKTCNAYIAEPFQECPLCQNELAGEDDMIIFPVTEKTRKKSVLFRIVTYISILAIILSVCLDFILGLHGERNWSIIVMIWCTYAIVVIAPLFIRLRPIGEIIWNTGFWGIAGSLLTVWYLDSFDVYFGIILPIIIIVMLVAEFIITLAEKYTGSMPYFLMSVFGTMLLVLIRVIAGYEQTVLLNVALSVAAILVVLLLALKSERMIGDISKRISL